MANPDPTPTRVSERTWQSYSFGPFEFFPERQLLLKGGAPVRVGGRALDLLTALVRNAGKVVTKRALIAHAWPSVVVDEANLKVNMSALRGIGRWPRCGGVHRDRYGPGLPIRGADSSGRGPSTPECIDANQSGEPQQSGYCDHADLGSR
jgi:hypothetical protein